MVKELDNSSILEEIHEDEEKLLRDEKRVKAALILMSVFVLILLAGVSYLIVRSITGKESTPAIVKVIQPSISVAPTASPSSLTTPTPASAISIETTNKSTVKDNYINLGSGSNQSTDWVDVSGTLTTADIGQYQNIKEVHFEAFINVPTANGSVSVRLFNKTDKHPVWNSEVTRDGTSETYHFISPAVTYDTGPKLYQVQMKTQFGVLANLTSSRIHVVTK